MRGTVEKSEKKPRAGAQRAAAKDACWKTHLMLDSE